MPDRILVTTDDLEHAVRINAGLEAAGFHTTLAPSLDEARQAIRRDPAPDCIGVTGWLHEAGAAQLRGLALATRMSPFRLLDDTGPVAMKVSRLLRPASCLLESAGPAAVTT